MTLILRRTFGNVHVVATKGDDDSWTIDVSDAISRPVNEEEHKQALEAVLKELSSLRAHVWKALGNDDK